MIPAKDQFPSASLQKKVTFFIVLASFLIRVIRLDIPHDWSFDEVYHALSAEAYALNDPRGYEWWNPSPKDLAWEWLHPPIGKLLMAGSIKLFAKPYIPESKSAPLDAATTFAWRFPGTIFAALTVWLLIKFGKEMFGSFWIGAVAGALYALDGLSFVQSRTGMNDIYVTFFVAFSFYRLYLFLSQYPRRKLINLLWLGIATGFGVSTKWTGFYVVGIIFLWVTTFLLKKADWRNIVWAPILVGLLPALIYFFSYGQWWLQGHTWKQFMELHQQIWWYQTGLKATHDYQSPALSWPILMRPVWFYVKYEDVVKDGAKQLYIGNIYSMGHPLIWWAGLVAIIYVFKQVIQRIWKSTKSAPVLPFLIIATGYLGMFLPWAFSPRIMFMYHYLPSVPFLCLALAYSLYQLKRTGSTGKTAVNVYLVLVGLLFIYFYPHWSALPLPQPWVNQYYWLRSWK